MKTVSPFASFPSIVAFILFTFFSSLGLGATTPLTLTAGNEAVQFDAIGRPSALKIHGVGKDLTGDLKIDAGKLNGAVSFKLDSMTTGVSLRDHHMKEKYLETGKFPDAKLEFTDVALPPEAAAAADFDGKAMPIKGQLTLHGKTKPLDLGASVSRKGSRYDVHSDFSIKLSDFGIDIPSFARITVAEDVNVKVQFQAAAAAAAPATAQSKPTTTTK